MDNRYNRLIRPSDFDSAEFIGHIKASTGRETFPRHRKFWEWGKGWQALSELGYLNRDKVALGLGVGIEPFPYFLSQYVKHVYRTDFIDESNPWMKDYASKVRADKGRPSFVPKSLNYDEDRVSFLNVDAMNLREIDDESVDIVFSFSSIEHFGNRITSPPHGSVKCMQESERVLRPGGICLGATELLLTEAKHHQFYRNEDFIKEVVQSHIMRPIEEFDLTLDDSLHNSKYYFHTILRSIFKEKLTYQDEIMGFILGDALVVSVFFCFIK